MKKLNEYRVMWIIVFFDLPTSTKKDRKISSLFRKRLLQDGFYMFQFSVYIRHCPSMENADAHIKRVKNIMPPIGKVGILRVTDKQFGSMQIFYRRKPDKVDMPYQQLELF